MPRLSVQTKTNDIMFFKYDALLGRCNECSNCSFSIDNISSEIYVKVSYYDQNGMTHVYEYGITVCRYDGNYELPNKSSAVLRA